MQDKASFLVLIACNERRCFFCDLNIFVFDDVFSI